MILKIVSDEEEQHSADERETFYSVDDSFRKFALELKEQWDAFAKELSGHWTYIQKNVAALQAESEAWAVKHDEAVRSFAEKGWTVPSWFTYSLLHELSEVENPDSEIVALYREGDPSQFETTLTELQASPHMSKWDKLFQQIAEAFRRGEHAITIPSLLLILEGYIAAFASQGRPERKRDKNVQRLLRQAIPKSVFATEASIWQSAVFFIEKLFASADFAGDVPSFVNRNWVLHGRAAASEWDFADALRILNAISTLDWLIGRRSGRSTIT